MHPNCLCSLIPESVPLLDYHPDSFLILSRFSLVILQADEENLDDTEKEVEGKSVKEITEDSEVSIDEEIARSVRKNRKAKKVEKVRWMDFI